jgi:hypothetical protein
MTENINPEAFTLTETILSIHVTDAEVVTYE